MFCGIVETTGSVRLAHGGKLTIEVPWNAKELKIGQSVAVDGCCLTIVEIKNGAITFDVSPETVARTTFGRLKPGDRVNLERGMKLGDSIDGHLVSGHIDCKGSLRSRGELADGAWSFWFTVPARNLRWLAEKGSIAIDGVSLTVNDLDAHGFSVCLIPHTLEVTTLGGRKAGDEVNLEFDLIAKYVERLLLPRETATLPRKQA